MTVSERSKIWYLDTSVVLRISLGHSVAAADWFSERADAGDSFVTSRLTLLESVRVLRRESLSVDLIDELCDSLVLLTVDNALLAEAGRIAVHVKLLDALHLASAQRVGSDVATVVTHDTAMLRAATMLGFVVHDPVSD